MLLTGIHLMQTGEVEANLPRLNEIEKLPYIAELVQRKLAGKEKERLASADVEFHRGEYQRLRAKLEDEHRASRLPEAARAKDALHDLLVQLRMK